jgi:hypothetical protein
MGKGRAVSIVLDDPERGVNDGVKGDHFSGAKGYQCVVHSISSLTT